MMMNGEQLRKYSKHVVENHLEKSASPPGEVNPKFLNRMENALMQAYRLGGKDKAASIRDVLEIRE